MPSYCRCANVALAAQRAAALAATLRAACAAQFFAAQTGQKLVNGVVVVVATRGVDVVAARSPVAVAIAASQKHARRVVLVAPAGANTRPAVSLVPARHLVEVALKIAHKSGARKMCDMAGELEAVVHNEQLFIDAVRDEASLAQHSRPLPNSAEMLNARHSTKRRSVHAGDNRARPALLHVSRPPYGLAVALRPCRSKGA